MPAAAGQQSAVTAACTHRPDRIAEQTLHGASRTAPRSIESNPTTSGCDRCAVSASIAGWLTGRSVQASSIEAPANQEGAIPLSPRVVAGGESARAAEPSMRRPTDHEATECHEPGRGDPSECVSSAEGTAVIRRGHAGHRGGLPGRHGGPRAGHFAGRRLLPRRPPCRRPRPFARRVAHRAHPAYQPDLCLASQTPSFACSSASSAAAKSWTVIRPPATN
jgi:hypothetical protein